MPAMLREGGVTVSSPNGLHLSCMQTSQPCSLLRYNLCRALHVDPSSGPCTHFTCRKGSDLGRLALLTGAVLTQVTIACNGLIETIGRVLDGQVDHPMIAHPKADPDTGAPHLNQSQHADWTQCCRGVRLTMLQTLFCMACEGTCRSTVTAHEPRRLLDKRLMYLCKHSEHGMVLAAAQDCAVLRVRALSGSNPSACLLIWASTTTFMGDATCVLQGSCFGSAITWTKSPTLCTQLWTRRARSCLTAQSTSLCPS